MHFEDVRTVTVKVTNTCSCSGCLDQSCAICGEANCHQVVKRIE